MIMILILIIIIIIIIIIINNLLYLSVIVLLAQSTNLKNIPDLEVLVFEEKGKSEYQEKNLSEKGREPTTNSTLHMKPSPGIEPGPHWWETSALTIAPPLLPPESVHFP